MEQIICHCTKKSYQKQKLKQVKQEPQEEDDSDIEVVEAPKSKGKAPMVKSKMLQYFTQKDP